MTESTRTSVLKRENAPLFFAVVLIVVAVVFLVLAQIARNTDNVGNHAVVDAKATNEVQTAVSQALVKVFSFDHSNPEPTEEFADQFLAEDARKDYDMLFKSLRERAPKQKLTLTAQVQVAGVRELTSDTATLLVFLDQASQRASDKESSVSAAQLEVSAEQIDGEWKITDLQPL